MNFSGALDGCFSVISGPKCSYVNKESTENAFWCILVFTDSERMCDGGGANMKVVLKNNLVVCLKASGINRSQLARRLHVSRAYVTRVLQGKSCPSLKVALDLCQSFNRPVEDFFELVKDTTTTQPLSRPPSAASGNPPLNQPRP